MSADYRIDDLARLCDTTVRSLRVLHDKDLLPSPELRGRTGFYTEQHVARVRLVLRLQERGFTLSAIRELLAAWENGRDLAGVLGLEQALTLPWHQEPAGRTTRAGLDERLGSPITSEQLADLEAIGVLHPDEEPDADGVLHYTVPSPDLITAGVEMVKVGIPLDAVNQLSAQLRADMYAAATRLTESVGEYLISDTPDNLPEAENVPDLIESVERLRRISSTSVAAWFGIVMDQAIADYISKISGWALQEPPTS